MTDTVRHLHIVARHLSPDAFAPFGVYGGQPARQPDWIASGSRIEGVHEDHIRRGSLVANLWNLGDVRFEGAQPFVGFVRYYNQGFQVAQLERHQGETQTWFARRGTGFLVVAPATHADEIPAPESASAFIVEPGDLVSIGSGIWMCHFFPITDEAEYLVITGRREPEQDRDLVNFVASANTVLNITLG